MLLQSEKELLKEELERKSRLHKNIKIDLRLQDGKIIYVLQNQRRKSFKMSDLSYLIGCIVNYYKQSSMLPHKIIFTFHKSQKNRKDKSDEKLGKVKNTNKYLGSMQACDSIKMVEDEQQLSEMLHLAYGVSDEEINNHIDF